MGAWSVNSNVDSEITHEGVRGPFYCKGNYYSYNKKSPFSHLIDPMPSSAGLGIHATHDLAGQLKFGPNTRWIEGEDYSVDEGLEGVFADAISEYFPKINASDLSPDYAGIRPKLVSSGEPAGDFDIRQSHDQSGQVTYVGLYGIESPGLTCAQPLADEIHNLI